MSRKGFIKGITIILGLISLLSPMMAQDYSVGSIISFSGEIWLDAFGNNVPVRIKQAGELIYKDSVIICGEDSTVQIRIMDQEKEIPQLSKVSIAQLVNLENKKNESQWLSPLLDLIQKITGALFPEEESMALISRGEEKPGIYNSLFAFEEEGKENDLYIRELDMLFEYGDSGENDFSASEFEFKKGFCYFQLGNYQDAARLLDTASQLVEREKGLKKQEPYYLDSLYLLEGISHYMLAEYTAAVTFLQKYLERNRETAYVPYASWLMADSLITLKKHEKAQVYIAMAKDYFSNHNLEKEFVFFVQNAK